MVLFTNDDPLATTTSTRHRLRSRPTILLTCAHLERREQHSLVNVREAKRRPNSVQGTNLLVVGPEAGKEKHRLEILDRAGDVKNVVRLKHYGVMERQVLRPRKQWGTIRSRQHT